MIAPASFLRWGRGSAFYGMNPLHWLLAALGCATFTTHLHGVETLDYEGGRYHVFRIDRADWRRLELAWLGADGKPLGDFNGLQRELGAQKKRLVFATNAGIYERGPKPCGLTVCAGQELVPLNLNPGEGNFFLKPNGVFYLDDDKGPGVMEAAEFGSSGIKPRIATQSGPLLMRKGVIHPAFNVNSPNKRQRSAVGVRSKDGQIIFVMSERENAEKRRVTFHQLTRVFLHLGCQDALYLDGDISMMAVEPPADAKFVSNTFAAMFYMAE